MSFPIKQCGLLRESRRSDIYSVFFPSADSLDGVREDRAAIMVANVASEANMRVRNDFDAVPIFQRPLVNATWNAKSRRWTDIAEQGEEGFTLTPTEPYREVLYRCRPFWYRLDMKEEHAPERVSVSGSPLPGFTLAPMFQNGREPVYRPAFEMGIGEDGLPHSRAGLTPLRTDGISLMEKARLYDPRARLESVKDWFSDLLLLLVEFATWRMDRYMTGNMGKLVETGKGMEGILSGSGSTGQRMPCIWRGKENPWRNARSLLCDVCLQNVSTESGYETVLYHLPDMRYYDGTLNVHYERVDTFFVSGAASSRVKGFGFKNGVFYPAYKGATDEERRTVGWLLSIPSDDRMITVGVGGGTDSEMVPIAIPGSICIWEAAQLGQRMASAFGGRLILDEA